jgi:hypothetical protein
MDEGLNNIRLDSSMMAGLYPRALVQLSQADVPAKSEKKPDPNKQPDEIRYLGNNVRNITVLVNNPEHTFLPEDQLAFLTKMLTACKLNIGDVAIVNTAVNTVIDEIINVLNPSKLIAFGVPVNTAVENIIAPPLSELVVESDQSKTLKMKLWGSLKQTFEV